jgi:Protein of unknown function (DUF4127)
MAKWRIVAIPVDGRPIVREQVCSLAALADCELIVPPAAALGHFRQAANCLALADWLFLQADGADGFVISIDMLVYGGLVPSRFIADSLKSLQSRLCVLAVLRQRYPDKPIYAFAATMRISNNNVAEEEKLYWNPYGERIWQWSFLADHAAVSGKADDLAAAVAAEAAVPAEIRADYLATRKRNLAVTMQVLAMVQDGLIDRLILPQDDTAQYGFNIAERRLLQQRVADAALQAKVSIYAGADEVLHTLVAHLYHRLSGAPPLRVALLYSDTAHVGSLTALYEDRPILDAIHAQICAADAVVVPSVEAADVVLGVHSSGAAQGDWAMRKPLPQQIAPSAAWLSELVRARANGKPVAIVDLAYANGGDPALIAALETVPNRMLALASLSGYAGWNTASNSIGSLAAQCVLSCSLTGIERKEDAEAVTCLRLLEDFVYQAVWRQRIRDDIRATNQEESGLTADELTAFVSARFIPPANDWLQRHGFAFRVMSIALPWQRTFEIDIHLERLQ